MSKNVLNQYSNDGICSYEYVDINGLKQYVQIRGVSKSNPILLVVHGGPGGALSGLVHVMQAEWEQHFTVVNFDQRNAGKTYVANKADALRIGKTGSMEDYLKDIDEVIAYLHTIYDFEKVYLMGFSWGSVIGAEYTKKYPQNIHAYIGVGQLVNYEKGYKLVCEKVLTKAKEQGNTKHVATIQKLIDEYPAENIMTKSRMQSVRMFAMLANKYLVKSAKPFPIGAILTSPFMKLKEKKAMLLSDVSLYDKTYQTMMNYDFTNNMRFEVPVYFITGDEDVNCPGELIMEQIYAINASEKNYISIKNASHMCFYDNREQFNKELLQIITCK